MPLPNLIRIWYCGDLQNDIPPYQILRGIDLNESRNSRATLSMMRILMKHVEGAAGIVNLTHLVKKCMNENDSVSLYHAVKHMFKFDCLRVGKKRRYETISWKMYYNILLKRKWQLIREKKTNAVSQTRRMKKYQNRHKKNL